MTKHEQINQDLAQRLEAEITLLAKKINTLLSGVPLEETYGTDYSKADVIESIGRIRNRADELVTRNSNLLEAVELARNYMKENHPPATFQ